MNNIWLYVNVREFNLMHVFYGSHTLTACLGHKKDHINSNKFDENNLFNQQKLYKCNKKLKNRT